MDMEKVREVKLEKTQTDRVTKKKRFGQTIVTKTKT